MPVCLYCLQDKPGDRFNREHVVPGAFGGFQDALVLHHTVCTDCNTHFGRTIDRILARGTAEGLQRYMLGVKDPSEVSRFEYHALRLAADVPGDYEGVLLGLAEDPDAPKGVSAIPITQVGFAESDGAGFVFFPLSELRSGEWKNHEGINWRKGVKVIGPKLEEARTILEEQGVVVSNWGDLEGPPNSGSEIDVIEWGQVTAEVQRAIAKIALNYAAYTQPRDFVLREQFDLIRRFIRFGEDPGFQVLGRRAKDIYTVESAPAPEMVAIFHVVTITEPLNDDAVLAQVSLFNWLQWEVVLSTSRAQDLVRIGHLFNLQDRTIYQLGHKSDRDRP